jgi:hypothetical protein
MNLRWQEKDPAFSRTYRTFAITSCLQTIRKEIGSVNTAADNRAVGGTPNSLVSSSRGRPRYGHQSEILGTSRLVRRAAAGLQGFRRDRPMHNLDCFRNGTQRVLQGLVDATFAVEDLVLRSARKPCAAVTS